MKIEDYDSNHIELLKEGVHYVAKKIGERCYSNFRSGDVSKFKSVSAKVKMIDNLQQTGMNTSLLCGIHRIKYFKNNYQQLHVSSSKEGIYFYHSQANYIFGCQHYYGIDSNLKFNKNGESLVIHVDKEKDKLSLIDDYNHSWSIPLSHVVGDDPYAFSFLMFEPQVQFEIKFHSESKRSSDQKVKDENYFEGDQDLKDIKCLLF